MQIINSAGLDLLACLTSNIIQMYSSHVQTSRGKAELVLLPEEVGVCEHWEEPAGGSYSCSTAPQTFPKEPPRVNSNQCLLRQRSNFSHSIRALKVEEKLQIFHTLHVSMSGMCTAGNIYSRKFLLAKWTGDLKIKHEVRSDVFNLTVSISPCLKANFPVSKQ